MTYNGSTWSKPVATKAAEALTSVSCPSATFCTAVSYDGRAVSYDGSTWSAATNIDSRSGSNGLQSISCPSAKFCAAVDGQGNAVTYNGSKWSKPVNADPGGYLLSVSCPSANFCAAVDPSGNIVTYNGTKWTKPVSADPKWSLISVSCPSAKACTAVDGPGHALTYNGTKWSKPVSIDPNGHLNSVSCPSATFCTAVDFLGYAFTYTATAPKASQTALKLSATKVTYGHEQSEHLTVTVSASSAGPPTGKVSVKARSPSARSSWRPERALVRYGQKAFIRQLPPDRQLRRRRQFRRISLARQKTHDREVSPKKIFIYA